MGETKFALKKSRLSSRKSQWNAVERSSGRRACRNYREVWHKGGARKTPN